MAIRFKAKEVDNHAERLICTGMIVSDFILSQMAKMIEPGVFTAKYTQTIANWCLEHYRNHQAAPKASIQDIFEFHKREDLDDDVSDLIETLLASLSEHFVEDNPQGINEDYILEQAEKYIKTRKAQMLSEDISALLSKGQILEAEAEIANYTIPKRPAADGDDIFTDDFWAEQEEDRQVLFHLPGALGDLVGPVERDSFISFLAGEKVGKSWAMMWVGLVAYRQRRNVAFFSAGDMTKPQMRRRFKHMLTHVDPKRPKTKVMRSIPDCYYNQHDCCPLDQDTDPIMQGGRGKEKTLGDYEDFPDHQTCTKCWKSEEDKKHFIGAPWWEEVAVEKICKPIDAAYKRLLQRSGNKSFRLFCYPPATLTVSMLKAQLDILQQQEGFVPDVIIIDYADILQPEESVKRQEFRHQINATWMALRALSQERNCAVITATQAKLEAKKRSRVEQWDTSEDKRKLAHVTAMLALAQDPYEKRKGMMRISNIAARDDDFDTNHCVVALQCLALGEPGNYFYDLKTPPKSERKLAKFSKASDDFDDEED